MPLIAYYRVSTRKQGASGLGLEAQQAAVRAYATRIGATIVAEYTEIESGRKNSRPKLRECISVAKLQGATVVVAKLDRLARDARFLLQLVDSGASLLFLDLPDLPAGDPIIGRLILTVMAAVAEFEARRIGQRTREGHAAYKARGGKLGAADPRCPGKRSRTSEEQRQFARMGLDSRRRRAAEFRAAARPLAVELRKTMTLEQVAEEFNRRGIATPRKRKWTPGLIHRLLRET